MKKVICIILNVFCVFNCMVAYSSSDTGYEWFNLPIGGHGFVVGMAFHPLEKDLFYARTDVGGIYRWEEKTRTWIQLCDTFTREDNLYASIAGFALDPQNTDVIYIASGAYTWQTGDVLKSTDRGLTWEKTGLNKKFEGNGAQRDAGECIAVDPNNSSIIYCGTAMEGLWKSDDGAVSWQQVKDVDTDGTTKNRIRTVVFDKNNTANGRSQTIYVGVSGKGLYETTSGGEMWRLIEGSPKTIARMELGASGALYCASETGLFKYYGEKWEEISPASEKGKRHKGIAVDPTNEDILMCVGSGTNYMSMPIYRSLDGGKTWVDVLQSADLQNMLKWDHQTGSNFSSNTADLKIDPFNPKRVAICDFFGVFMTEDVTTQPRQKWVNEIRGIEEVVPRDAICPPTGKYPLIAAIADVDGFVFEDITQYPERMIRKVRQVADEPWMMTSASIDFCEEDPNIILRVGVDWNTNGKAEYSLDNTETWHNITTIPKYVDDKGNELQAMQLVSCAISSQKHPDTGLPVFVIIPAYSPNDSRKMPKDLKMVPLVSFDLGETWTQTKGFPDDINIYTDFWNLYKSLVSDRVSGKHFYVYAKTHMYVSEDWGLTWTQTAKIDGNPYSNVVVSPPNSEGEVWCSMDWNVGVHRSKDYGKTFEALGNVSNCVAFGFGKEAPGNTNPTLYLYGTVDGLEGMYRSTDMGETFVQINDKRNQLSAIERVIRGDRQRFGIVYIQSGGHSFYVGKPEDLVLEKSDTGAIISGEPGGIYRLYYNGEEMKFANRCVIEDTTVLVPAREFLEYFGAELEWDDETNSLLAKRKVLNLQLSSKVAFGEAKDMQALFSLENKTISANGEQIKTDIAPHLINDRMYIPLNAVLKALEASCVVSDNESKIMIEDKHLVMYN